jgi:hypothetical protein
MVDSVQIWLTRRLLALPARQADGRYRGRRTRGLACAVAGVHPEARSLARAYCAAALDLCRRAAHFVPVFVRFGLYRAIFRYTGLATMQTLLKAAVVWEASCSDSFW